MKAKLKSLLEQKAKHRAIEKTISFRYVPNPKLPGHEHVAYTYKGSKLKIGSGADPEEALECLIRRSKTT